MNASERFAALHRDLLILPNCWDVTSALLLEAAGFPAIGTTSLGITAAAGLPDGAAAGRDLTVALASSLVPRLRVPLTVDLEGGYSDSPAEVGALVAELASLGVAGVNLEDAHREVSHHAEIVAAAASTGLFVNARTDGYWLGLPSPLERSLERVAAYRSAGASGVFVPGVTDLASISSLAAVGLPLNVLAGAGSPADLHAHGVARISTGSALYRAALATAVAAAESARAGAALPPAVSYAEVQAFSSRQA